MTANILNFLIKEFQLYEDPEIVLFRHLTVFLGQKSCQLGTESSFKAKNRVLGHYRVLRLLIGFEGQNSCFQAKIGFKAINRILRPKIGFKPNQI